ncbi:probable G-protein coupled receptor Mth-like 12 [Acyrthosiphon pisum]|uniref:G-protein coupled receptors family 2 profile 2 domain-containing protein n=1 Tax=Acyrthosiphon pisum TaxID=7029 RepID=A0A8R2B9N9_ACYPI|nr:probable G-protein coupled receptor Mth-like 12 [Acyrthosiphon pisum]|eukprot:XP_008188613.2 PREDICTED: probable G-protein coupled receptor Mth-like 12 [Acyrthosiphon pisum]
MNTVRSCFATKVAFLVVAIGWWAVDALVCCNSSSVASGGGDLVASCQNKNRTFHTVEEFGGGTCDDNWTALPIWKCCGPGESYDRILGSCKPSWANGDKQMHRMMQLLKDEFQVVADAVMVGFNYEPPLCDAGNVLVDVPPEDMMFMFKANSSVAELLPRYCFDLTPPDGLVARTCMLQDLFCKWDVYKCMHMCCKGDRMMVDGPNGPECTLSEKPLTMSAYGIDEGDLVLPYYEEFKCSHRDILDDGFNLVSDGLYLINEDQYVTFTEYCVGYSQVTDSIVAYICDADTVFMDKRARASSIHLFYLASYVASAVCLALTLLLYNTLPSLRNTQNYYVKCYVQHQFLACIYVIYQMSMKSEKKDESCFTFGYITLFIFLSTLCWLNVMCFDIYWKIRYNISTNRNTSTSVRTIMYYFYCCGLPSIFVCTGFFLEYSQDEWLRSLAPNFKEDVCFYYSMYGWGNVVFIMLPVFVMLTANIIMFLLTAIYCSRIKSQLNKFRRTDSRTECFLVYKEIFVMSTKLFVIMEFPYLSMLPIFLQHDWFKWYIIILSAANSLQGVFIFLILVAKCKVIMDLRNKFRCSMDHSEPTQINNISGSS